MKIRDALLGVVAVITLGTAGCSRDVREYFDPFEHAVGLSEQTLIASMKKWEVDEAKRFEKTVVKPKAGTFFIYKGDKGTPFSELRTLVVNVIEGTTDPSEKV